MSTTAIAQAAEDAPSVDVRNAVERLGCSEANVYRLINTGELRAFRSKNRKKSTRILLSDLDAHQGLQVVQPKRPAKPAPKPSRPARSKAKAKRGAK